MVLQADADVLVELGAGTCEKSRVLLDAMQSCGRLGRYVPLDVSDTTLWAAASSLAEEYPGLAVQAVVGDFHRHLDRSASGDRRLFAFLGGTIGNLDPDQRAAFLAELGAAMAPGDRLLLGTDLVKDRARAGAPPTTTRPGSPPSSTATCSTSSTASSAPTSTRSASSTWPAGTRPTSASRCGSARCDDRRIRVADLDLDLEFRAGEEMLTEISTKFSPDALEAELTAIGFEVEAHVAVRGRRVPGDHGPPSLNQRARPPADRRPPTRVRSPVRSGLAGHRHAGGPPRSRRSPRPWRR